MADNNEAKTTENQNTTNITQEDYDALNTIHEKMTNEDAPASLNMNVNGKSVIIENADKIPEHKQEKSTHNNKTADNKTTEEQNTTNNAYVENKRREEEQRETEEEISREEKKKIQLGNITKEDSDVLNTIYKYMMDENAPASLDMNVNGKSVTFENAKKIPEHENKKEEFQNNKGFDDGMPNMRVYIDGKQVDRFELLKFIHENRIEFMNAFAREYVRAVDTKNRNKSSESYLNEEAEKMGDELNEKADAALKGEGIDYGDNEKEPDENKQEEKPESKDKKESENKTKENKEEKDKNGENNNREKNTENKKQKEKINGREPTKFPKNIDKQYKKQVVSDFRNQFETILIKRIKENEEVRFKISDRDTIVAEINKEDKTKSPIVYSLEQNGNPKARLNWAQILEVYRNSSKEMIDGLKKRYNISDKEMAIETGYAENKDEDFKVNDSLYDEYFNEQYDIPDDADSVIGEIYKEQDEKFSENPEHSKEETVQPGETEKDQKELNKTEAEETEITAHKEETEIEKKPVPLGRKQSEHINEYIKNAGSDRSHAKPTREEQKKMGAQAIPGTNKIDTGRKKEKSKDYTMKDMDKFMEANELTM